MVHLCTDALSSNNFTHDYWYWKARFFRSSVPSNNKVFRHFLKLSMFSSTRILNGRAFHNRDPLYSNMRFPYFVLKFGVSKSRKSFDRPLKLLNFNLRLSEQIPLTTLKTRRTVLNMIRDSTFNQWSSRRASLADSRRLLSRTSLAAAFCNFCNLNRFFLHRFMNKLLQ